MRKHNSDKGSRSRLGKILQRAISLCFGLPVAVIAGPEGEQVIVGDADVIRPDLVTTQIFQHSNNLLLDWNTFDIATDEIVIFHQPGSNSIAVNRVVGGTASEIYGQLQANGQVFLLNPQGVFFSPTAQLDVHGLVAAAGTMNTADFLSGKLTITTSGETVENQGTLVADNGGYILLAGSRVENHGRISTGQGSVGMASGGRITLNIAGDELIGFTVDEATVAAAAGIENTGDILNDGGFIALEAKVAHDLAGTVINQSGRIRAHSISTENGRILLRASGGNIAVSGELDTDGMHGADGGDIVVYTDHDAVLANGAHIHADGSAGGNGGMIRAIASRDLDVQANSLLSAGGAQGGFIEVSGHDSFTLAGDIHLGNGGTLLIDPTDITISDTGDVTSAQITTQLNSGVDVLLVASNSITIDTGISASGGAGNLHFAIGTVTTASCGSDPFCTGTPVLTLGADGTIMVLGDAVINILGDLRFTAQDGVIQIQESITSSGGSIYLDAGALAGAPQHDGVVDTGSANQHDITIKATGDIIVNAGTSVHLGNLLSTASGNISITADGGSNSSSGIVHIDGGTMLDAINTNGVVSITATGGQDSGFITVISDIDAGSITMQANSDPNGGQSSVILLDSALNARVGGIFLEAKHTGSIFGSGDGAYITVTGDITSADTVIVKAMSNAERGGVINTGNINSIGTTSIQNKNSDFNVTVPTMIIGDINANLISINLQGNNFVTGALNASSYVDVLNSGGSITVNGNASSTTSFVAIQSGSLARPAATSLVINGNVSGPNGVSLKSGNTSIDGTSLTLNGSATSSGGNVWVEANGRDFGGIVNVSGTLTGENVTIKATGRTATGGPAGVITIADATATVGSVLIDARGMESPSGLGTGGNGGNITVGTLTAVTGITVDSLARGTTGGNIAISALSITGTGNIALTAISEGSGANIDVFSAINNTGGSVQFDADARGGNGADIIVADSFGNAAGVSAANDILIDASTTGIGGNVVTDSLTATGGQVRIGSTTRRVSGDVNTGAISAQTNVDIHGAGDISTAAIVATTGGVTLDTSTTATGLGDISTGSITAANAIALSAIGGIGAGNVNIGGTVSGTTVTVTAQGETTSAGTSGSIAMSDITTTSGDVTLGATGMGAGNVNGTGGDGGNIAVGTINSSGNITVTAIGNGTTGGNIDSTGGMTSGNGAYSVSLNATAADTGANVTLDDGLGNRQDITSGGGINIHATAGISGGDVTAGNITGLTFAGSMIIGGPSGVTGSIDVGNLTMGSNQIILRSSDGSITTGNINASDSLTIQTTTSNDNLGNISVGDIAANSTVSIQSSGGANGGNITAGTIGNAVNNVSISTNAGDGGGNIRLTGTLTAAQNASLSATGTGAGGSILIEDTGGNARDVTAGNGIVIFASNDVTAGNLTASGALARVGSSTSRIGGDVNLGNVSGQTNVDVYGIGDITTGSLTATTGDVTIDTVTSTGGLGNISTAALNATGTVTLSAAGGTGAGNIAVSGAINGGNVSATAFGETTSSGTSGSITLTDITANSGDITLTATGTGAGNINGTGGDGGNITVGTLTAGGTINVAATGSGTTGGNIAIDALSISGTGAMMLTAIAEGSGANIDVFSAINNTGGSVQLDADARGGNGANITVSDGMGTLYGVTAGTDVLIDATATGTGGGVLVDSLTATGGKVRIGSTTRRVSSNLDLSSITAQTSVDIHSSGDINVDGITATTAGITLDTSSATASVGDISAGTMNAAGNVVLSAVGGTGAGNIAVTGAINAGGLNATAIAETTGSGPSGSITLADVTTTSGAVTLNATGTGAGNVNGTGGDGGNISVGTINATGDIDFRATGKGTTGGNIASGALASSAGDVIIRATGTDAGGNVNITGNVSGGAVFIDTQGGSGINGESGSVTVTGDLTATVQTVSILADASGGGTFDGANITVGNIDAVDSTGIAGTSFVSRFRSNSNRSGSNITMGLFDGDMLSLDANSTAGGMLSVGDVLANTGFYAASAVGGLTTGNVLVSGGEMNIDVADDATFGTVEFTVFDGSTPWYIISRDGNVAMQTLTVHADPNLAGPLAVSVEAGENLNITGPVNVEGDLNLQAVSTGNAGNVTVSGNITAGSLSVTATGETAAAVNAGNIMLADVTATSGAVTLTSTGLGAGGVSGTGGDGGNISVGTVNATGDIDFRATSSGTTGGNIASGALASSAGDVIIRATGTDAGGNVNVTGNVSGGAVFIDTQGGSGINGESGSVTVTGDLTATAQWVTILADANGSGSFDGANITVGNIDAVDSTGTPGTLFVSRFRSNSSRSGSNITIGNFDGDMLSLDTNSTDGGVLSVGDVLANTGFYASSAAGGLTTGNVLVTGGEMNIDVADDATFGTVEFTVFDDSAPWYIISRDGSVAMQALTVHADAGLSEPSAVEVHAAGGISIGGDVLVDDFLVLEAGDDISLAANLTAGGILARSNGAISIIGATDIGDVQYAGTTPVFDADLNTHLADNGLSTVSGTAAASFIANSVDFGGTLTYAGDYLYLAADSLSLASASLADPDAVVQIATFTPGTIISLKNVADTTTGLNLAWTGMLGNFSGGTIVLGRSSDTSDVQIGSNGTIDIGTTNFMALTSGTVDSTSQLVSTGVVAAPLGTVPVVEEPFLPPQYEEIEPVAEVTEDVADEQATDENEEEEEGLADADGDTDNTDESSLAIRSSTAETLQCE